MAQNEHHRDPAAYGEFKRMNGQNQGASVTLIFFLSGLEAWFKTKAGCRLLGKLSRDIVVRAEIVPLLHEFGHIPEGSRVSFLRHLLEGV